jgi:hypothetical protein
MTAVNKDYIQNVAIVFMSSTGSRYSSDLESGSANSLGAERAYMSETVLKQCRFSTKARQIDR